MEVLVFKAPSFEQISIQRLTGVPTPLSGGRGGWGLAGLEFGRGGCRYNLKWAE